MNIPWKDFEMNLEIVVKELRSTLGKMELAIGSIDEAIVWTGEDTGIQWCNMTFDRLVNQPHIAILGNPFPDLLPLTQQGKDIPQSEHPVFKILAREFQTSEYEFLQQNKILVLEISGSYLELKNGERTAVMTIRDISKRKRMEADILALNQRLKIENLRMSAELDILKQMQQLILPKATELAAILELDIAGFMEPADEVGGDYYDVLYTEGVVTIAIGDVTGHGLESGILMVMAQAAVRTLQEMPESDPVRFLDTLNRTLYKNIQRMKSDKNLTLALLNYADGRISISGQHEETLVVRKDGQIERIDMMDLGFPIGLDENIAEFISHVLVNLEPGDGVVLYTDGIPEARNIHKKFYGIERLCEVLSQNWHFSAEQIKQATINDLREFIGEQKVFDDITLLVLKQQAKIVHNL